jgi:hypothetical protein
MINIGLKYEDKENWREIEKYGSKEPYLRK